MLASGPPKSHGDVVHGYALWDRAMPPGPRAAPAPEPRPTAPSDRICTQPPGELRRAAKIGLILQQSPTAPQGAVSICDTIQQPGLNSLSKSFEPAAIEAQWGPEWEKRGYGAAGFRGTGAAQADAPSFAIQLPPPNVTGTLHMGHAFNHTIMDSLTRYHRMKGFNTVWVPGTDHAGIATQIVVERQLQEQKLSRHDLGRKNFVSKVWEWKEKSGNTITTQMRRMGDSVDWSREYFTMDDKLSSVVTD